MAPLFFVEMLRLMLSLPQEIINDEIRVTVPPLEGKLEDLLRKPWPPGVRMLCECRFHRHLGESVPGHLGENLGIHEDYRDQLGVFLSHAIVKVY